MLSRHQDRPLRRGASDGVDGNGCLNDIGENTINKSEIDDNELNFNPPGPKKQRGRPQKQQWTHEWSDKATEALIELWSNKEELYNKQHPQFYFKESKDIAVEEIKIKLNERGFDVTSSHILSKFQSLRTYFCTQRTKCTSTTKKAGMRYNGIDEGESKWRFYKSLMFLDDNMKPRESQRKHEFKSEYDMPTPSFTLRSMASIEPPIQQFREYAEPTPDYLRESALPLPIGNNIFHNNNHNSSLEHSPVDDTKILPLDQTKLSPTLVDMNGYDPNVSKHEDFLFGELVGNMIHQLPPGQHKDMIKLDIQQLIIKAKYASAVNPHENQARNHLQL